jgi:hypothetical protein
MLFLYVLLKKAENQSIEGVALAPVLSLIILDNLSREHHLLVAFLSSSSTLTT